MAYIKHNLFISTFASSRSTSTDAYICIYKTNDPLFDNALSYPSSTLCTDPISLTNHPGRPEAVQKTPNKEQQKQKIIITT